MDSFKKQVKVWTFKRNMNCELCYPFVYTHQGKLLWYAEYFDVSLDYIFGRTDKPQGTEFIEACFDPRSPMNAKLKELMFQLAEGGDA